MGDDLKAGLIFLGVFIILIFFYESWKQKKVDKVGRYRYEVLMAFHGNEKMAVTGVAHRLRRYARAHRDFSDSYVHNRLEELVELGFLAKEIVTDCQSIEIKKTLYFKTLTPNKE